MLVKLGQIRCSLALIAIRCGNFPNSACSPALARVQLCTTSGNSEDQIFKALCEMRMDANGFVSQIRSIKQLQHQAHRRGSLSRVCLLMCVRTRVEFDILRVCCDQQHGKAIREGSTSSSAPKRPRSLPGGNSEQSDHGSAFATAGLVSAKRLRSELQGFAVLPSLSWHKGTKQTLSGFRGLTVWAVCFGLRQPPSVLQHT